MGVEEGKRSATGGQAGIWEREALGHLGGQQKSVQTKQFLKLHPWLVLSPLCSPVEPG